MTIKIIIIFVIIEIYLVQSFKGGIPEEETLEMSQGNRQELTRQKKKGRGGKGRISWEETTCAEVLGQEMIC